MKQTLARVVVPFSLKADVDLTSRTFEGLAATWDLDLGQDVIHKGAFTDTLKEWKSSGESLPLLNSHDHFNIFSALGQMVSATETKEGLDSTWEVLDGPEGDAVLNRLRPSKRTKRSVVGKMSIGFEPVQWEMEQPEGTTSFWDQIRHLKKVNLKEVSLVLFPMQPNASIDASTVKSFMISMQNTDPRALGPWERKNLRQLATRIGNVLKKSDAATVQSTETETVDEPEPIVSSTPPITEPETPPEPKVEPPIVETIPPAKVYQFGEALQMKVDTLKLRARLTDVVNR
jgi:HK97 family phage prohead protease